MLQKYVPALFAGGCLVVVLTLLVGSRDYNGTGMELIYKAMNGKPGRKHFY